MLNFRKLIVPVVALSFCLSCGGGDRAQEGYNIIKNYYVNQYKAKGDSITFTKVMYAWIKKGNGKLDDLEGWVIYEMYCDCVISGSYSARHTYTWIKPDNTHYEDATSTGEILFFGAFNAISNGEVGGNTGRIVNL